MIFVKKNRNGKKLHEAIVEILENAGRPMTTNEIADEINRTGSYTKRDHSPVTAFQIHGRTRNYSHLFERDGSLVSLTGGPSTPSKRSPSKVQQMNNDISQINPVDAGEVESSLMNQNQFKNASDIDYDVPDDPGMYCIRIDSIDALPEPFRSELIKRDHNIIYIGIASKSLNRRMLNQELRANGHGTFFRSLGAVLGYCPPFNSLAEKKNKRNYKFSPEDEMKIIDWINNNLLINWVTVDENIENIETFLIGKYKPLLNLDKNPAGMDALRALRRKCVDVANGIGKI